MEMEKINMEKFEIGTKLYHYYHGPMTVIECDESYVTAMLDIPRKDAYIHTSKTNTVKFNMKAFDYWYFDDAKKIGKEINEVPFDQGQKPFALNPDYSLMHPFFSGKIKNLNIDKDEASPIKPTLSKSKNEEASAIRPIIKNPEVDEASAIRPVK